MRYIEDRIVEVITSKRPSQNDEIIILINGFEDLRIYADVAYRVFDSFSGANITCNIKMAKRKWEELSKTADSTSKQIMTSNGWIAEQESVTYYRNLHDANMLLLLGTENEEDTGGLSNCFSITPRWLTDSLRGNYSSVLESCFSFSLSDDERISIDNAYKALFTYCPVDICRLSLLADNNKSCFDSIDDFCSFFGRTLPLWGFPLNVLSPYTTRDYSRRSNFLKGEKDFISGKRFQKLSTKQYKALENKIALYPQEGQYSGDSVIWMDYDFSSYSDLATTILEFARGENVQKNRERLLRMDYAIVSDILDFNPDEPLGSTKNEEKKVTGEPLEAFLSCVLDALSIAEEKKIEEPFGIKFDFHRAVVVTGFTDVDDDEKYQCLVDAWRNVCVNVNGILKVGNNTTLQATGSRQAIYVDNGTTYINDGSTISASSSERAAVHSKSANSKTYITGGTITSTGAYAVYLEAGEIEIGTKDGNIDTSKPIITGKTYGVIAYETYKFYDGIIKGKTYATGNVTAKGSKNNPTIVDDVNVIYLHHLSFDD